MNRPPIRPGIQAFGYVRFSSDGQADGDSERRQIAGIGAMAAKHRLLLIMLPPDRAVSAYGGNNLRNGSLGEFIEKARKGLIARGSWLLFEDFDRFSRAEASVAAEAMFSLVNLGIVLGTTSDGRTCRSGGEVTDFIVPLIKMQGAYDDNKKRAQRIKDGIIAKRAMVSRDAPLTGRVPAWLTVMVLEKAPNGKVIRSRIEEIPERASIVRRIFEMAGQGYGEGAIARLFNTDLATYPPFHGPKWHKSYIAKILSNRAVIGELQMYETERTEDGRKRSKIGEPVPGYFPAPVPFDVWLRAQAAKASRLTSRPGRPSRSGVNLFSGLCKCAECGGSMELRAKGEKNGGDYLICANRLRGVTCTSPRNYKLGKLETVFFDNWQGLFARQSDFHNGDDSGETAAAADNLYRIEQEMRAAQRRVDNLTEALAEAESADERRPIRAKLANEQGNLDGLTGKRTALVRALEIAQAIENRAAHDEMERVMQDALLSGDPDARRKLAQVLRETIRQVVFEDNRVHFYAARGQGALVATFTHGAPPKVSFERQWKKKGGE